MLSLSSRAEENVVPFVPLLQAFMGGRCRADRELFDVQSLDRCQHGTCFSRPSYLPLPCNAAFFQLSNGFSFESHGLSYAELRDKNSRAARLVYAEILRCCFPPPAAPPILMFVFGSSISSNLTNLDFYQN